MNTIKTLLIATTVSLYSGYSLAMSVNEIEPNNSIDTAQTLDLSVGNITVNAMMGPHDAPLIDADFYEFKAYAGDELTLNIDNGYSVVEPINTVIVVYSPAP